MLATASLLLTLLLLFLIDNIFNGNKIRRNGRPLKKPPNTLPLVGNGILFLQDRHKLFSWFVKCERQFGFETFQISVPSLPPGVVINDPKNLEFVMKNEGVFSKGDFFKKRSRDLFGNGIINADGELWKIQRKAGLQFLSNHNLKVLLNTALPLYLKHTVKSLKDAAAKQSTIDLEAVFHEFTTQLMGRMAYDMEMHAADDFTVAFEYASGKTGERFQNPLWFITEVFTGGRFRDAVKTVKKFGSVIIDNAIETRKMKETAAETTSSPNDLNSISGSLINSLLDSISDRQIVADAALNYLSAGRDTTAQALTWVFYLIMRNPRIVLLIRQEGEDALTLYQNHANNASEPAFTFPYTTAVFYEALRLYPPVPFEIKQCEQDTVLPDGTYLPRMSILLWCTWAMNRSRLIWGPESDQFKPERWLDEDGKIISKSAFEFPVFNGGQRTCLGKRMAETVTIQLIASLVRSFDFVPLDDKERISKNSLTLPMEGGLPCYVRCHARR
ncbi:cytochrome P450 [Xylogone sp. PMI_703]|nr:cytochrome P450 [Xylogone sp. PMI_703]